MITENNIQTLRGAKILIETLKKLGVDTIFGYPGGIVLDVYDELYNQTDIKHILVRHEQSAVHAAEGYARTTGKCGVVLVTSGPGATNTVSGIVNAYLDGSPLIVLTGQVFKDLLGKGAFQEANICEMTKSCTKKVYQITSASEIQQTIIEAMNIATSGKKGPVVIDLVKDIFSENASYKPFENPPEGTKKESLNLLGLIKRIKSSKKPVIVSGGGVMQSESQDDLFEFAKTFDIPVVDTMMGLGTFAQDDPNYFGMIGIFGDNAANQIVIDSDLIISLGARFNDRITCMFKNVDLSSKFFQIDINRDEISGFIPTLDYIVGDVKFVLNALNSELKSQNLNFSNWTKSAQQLKNKNKKRKKTSNLLHSFEVIRAIEEFTKNKDLIFTSEVGQHQLWACQNLQFSKNRKILVSGGSGTMGFGFPAAIGASIAKPNIPIVCITGDGSFQMGLHELATCKEYDLNIKIMILNNGYLGMVRQLQEKFCDSHYSQTKISNPDFVQLAKSYNIGAETVTKSEQISKALERAFNTTGTYIVNFAVEPEENL